MPTGTAVVRGRDQHLSRAGSTRRGRTATETPPGPEAQRGQWTPCSDRSASRSTALMRRGAETDGSTDLPAASLQCRAGHGSGTARRLRYQVCHPTGCTRKDLRTRLGPDSRAAHIRAGRFATCRQASIDDTLGDARRRRTPEPGRSCDLSPRRGGASARFTRANSCKASLEVACLLPDVVVLDIGRAVSRRVHAAGTLPTGSQAPSSQEDVRRLQLAAAAGSAQSCLLPHGTAPIRSCEGCR